VAKASLLVVGTAVLLVALVSLGPERPTPIVRSAQAAPPRPGFSLWLPSVAVKRPRLAAEDWGSDWIWNPGGGSSAYFRKSFLVDQPIDWARLDIGGDITRRVYVNGNLVAEEDLAYAFLPTSVDITPFISQGLNTIAVFADRGPSAPAAGLSLRCTISFASGEELVVVTDPSWRTWDRSVAGWAATSFNDQYWRRVYYMRPWNRDSGGDAWEIHHAVWDLHGGRFSGPAVPESPDLLVSYRWDEVLADDSWQRVPVHPAGVESVSNPAAFNHVDSLLTDEQGLTVLNSGNLVLDFGRELAGWIEFTSPNLAASAVISVSETLDPSTATGGILKGHQRGATRVYRLELNENEGLYSGFRYAWLKFGTPAHPWHITGLKAIWLVKPANYEGSFRASDPDLTRMWYTGAYSVRLNFGKKWISSILRPRGDRYPWAGDNRIADLTALVAFAHYRLVSADIHYWDAILDAAPPRSFNGIPGYTLHWIMNVVNQYRYMGNKAEMTARIPDLVSLMEEFEGYYNDPDQAGLNFIDFGAWGTNLQKVPSKPNVKLAYQMMHIQTLRELAWLMDRIDRWDLQQQFNAMADAHVEDFRAQHPEWAENAERHVAANALLAGFPNADERRQLWEVGFANPGQRLTATPFFSYFILDALASDDRHNEALEALQKMWGGMNSLDATCYWENYNPKWPYLYSPSMSWPTMSFCHPWASGVTPWLSNNVLGIRPTEPGFAQYDVIPHLGDLDWVEGTMPTRYGPISVSHRATVVEFITQLDSPEDTIARVGIPKTVQDIRTIHVNGALVWDGTSFYAAGGVGGVVEDPDFVYITGVAPGTTVITGTYDANPVFPRAEPPQNIVVDNEDESVIFDDAKWTTVHHYWYADLLIADAYGTGYYTAKPGDGSVRFEFPLDVPRSGSYNVYLMWAELPDAATNTPVTIQHADGADTFRVNQQTNGHSLWNYLGTFRFSEETPGSAVIANAADGVVVADAVRLEWVPPLP
jgi:alpha-L-rhamnosidase